MKVVVTSDFHGSYPETVPRCDLLIVAGDCIGGSATTHDRERNIWSWLERQPAETIVGIAGNHDFLVEEDNEIAKELPWIYLEDSGTVIDGVHFWGSPWSMYHGPWAFQLHEHDLAKQWALIPPETEVLITHGPAYGINDKVFRGENIGSRTLREVVRERLPNLRLLVSGHAHEAYGKTGFQRRSPDGPVWVQAVNGCYTGPRKQPPIVVEL